MMGTKYRPEKQMCKNLATVATLFVTLLFFGGTCAEKRVVSVHGEGASFPDEVYQSWIPMYVGGRQAYIDLLMDYAAVGSSAGKEAILNDPEVDYAGSDSLLTAEEQAQNPDLVMFPTMAGAVVVAYNLPGIGEGLVFSIEVLVAIYNGTISRWNDADIAALNPNITLPDEAIVVLARGDGSGSTSIFTSALASSSNWHYGSFSEGRPETSSDSPWPPGVIQYYGYGNQGISGLILSFYYSLGYVAVSVAAEVGISLASLMTHNGDVVTANQEYVQAAMETAAHYTNSLTVSLTEYADLSTEPAYPLASYTYLIVKLTEMRDCGSATELLRYIDWFLTDSGAEIICIKKGMVPLSVSVISKIRDTVINVMSCGGENVWEMVEDDLSAEAFDQIKQWMYPLLATAALIVAVLIAIISHAAYKHHRFNQLLDRNDWEVPIEDIIFYTTYKSPTGRPHFVMWPSVTSLTDVDEIEDGHQMVRQILQWPGKWNGQTVGLRLLEIKALPKVERRTKALLMWMKDHVTHPNVLTLHGLSELQGDRYVVSDYCAKGPLDGVLQDVKYALRLDFKFCIAMDIINGLGYLHAKKLIHGMLTSKTCLVDSKWTVRIADWEFTKLYSHTKSKRSAVAELRKKPNEIGRNEAAMRDFWTAPEMLRDNFHQPPTASCDVYSYAIILQEIFTQKPPYQEHVDSLTPSELLKAVLNNHLRPSPSLNCPTVIRQIMELSWSEDPIRRPSSDHIMKTLRNAHNFKKSVIDTMMETLDNYTNSLEEQLEAQGLALDLMEQRLNNFQSRSIPPHLKLRLDTLHDHQNELTSGLASLEQNNVVNLAMFKLVIPHVSLGSRGLALTLQRCDQILSSTAKRFGAFKVDIVGGEFLLITGLGKDAHATTVINITAQMVADIMSEVSGTHEGDISLLCGLHTGVVYTAVVDAAAPHTYVIGSCLERARVIMMASQPGHILISKAFHVAMDKNGVSKDYEFVVNAEHIYKAEEAEETYWMRRTTPLSEKDLAKKDPATSEASAWRQVVKNATGNGGCRINFENALALLGRTRSQSLPEENSTSTEATFPDNIGSSGNEESADHSQFELSSKFLPSESYASNAEQATATPSSESHVIQTVLQSPSGDRQQPDKLAVVDEVSEPESSPEVGTRSNPFQSTSAGIPGNPFAHPLYPLQEPSTHGSSADPLTQQASHNSEELGNSVFPTEDYTISVSNPTMNQNGIGSSPHQRPSKGITKEFLVKMEEYNPPPTPVTASKAAPDTIMSRV